MAVRDVVGVELSRLRYYVEDVGTAATASPGSAAWSGPLSKDEVDRAIACYHRSKGALTALAHVWEDASGPGLVGFLRRCLLRAVVLRELAEIRRRLDEVRVGEHPRWKVPVRL